MGVLVAGGGGVKGDTCRGGGVEPGGGRGREKEIERARERKRERERGRKRERERESASVCGWGGVVVTFGIGMCWLDELCRKANPALKRVLFLLHLCKPSRIERRLHGSFANKTSSKVCSMCISSLSM